MCPMPTDQELIIDALKRVEIALACPDLTDNERIILEMQYIRGHDAKDVAGGLVMKPKEYNTTKASMLDKICRPLPREVPVQQMEAE